MARAKRRSKQRRHEPWHIGPRVYRRGRYWWIDLRYAGRGRVPLRDPQAAGWPQRGERTEFSDVAERWKWAYADLVRTAAHRRQVGERAEDDRSVADAINAYLEHRAMTVEPNTVRNDHASLGMLHEWVGGDVGVSEITTAILQAHFNTLRRDGYALSTMEIRRVNLQAFFEWCGRVGRDNPARDVVVAKGAKEEARAFTDGELRHLRVTADRLDRTQTPGPQKWRFWLELALCTGGRFGELMALEWSAFRQADRTVRFTRQIDTRGTGTKPLKGKDTRTALVLPEFWRFAKRRATGRVLTPQIEAGVSRFGAERWAHVFYEHAGIKEDGNGWHVWRHTYARLFLERGGTMEELQRSLGHASIKTTQDTYGHFSTDKAAALARGRIYAR